MANIRALERADLPAVVALLRDHAGNGVPGADATDEEILAAMVLEHPWSDADLPSLVAVGEDGAVIGFIGAQVRRMVFDGRPIRGVCCTKLVVAPEHRAGAPGALLMGRLLSGPQDVSWSDSSTDPVVRAWRAFGGHVDHARAADFMLVLRPGRWIGSMLSATARRQGLGREVTPVGALPLRALLEGLSRRAVAPRAPGVEGEDASTASIVEQLPALSRRIRVRVDWDAEQLDHVFDQIESADGPVVRRVVRLSGRPIGWYAYRVRPGGVSTLLHLAAHERASDQVFGELIDHATSVGSSVLAGRAEPHLEWPLHSRSAVLGFARRPTIRAREPELAACLATSAGLLTRLDGEVFVP